MRAERVRLHLVHTQPVFFQPAKIFHLDAVTGPAEFSQIGHAGTESGGHPFFTAYIHVFNERRYQQAAGKDNIMIRALNFP
jgi:hypothetical protein